MATCSVLNPHKSSIEPPPLVKIMLSNKSLLFLLYLLADSIAFLMLLDDASPWTIVGIIKILVKGQRLFIVIKISFIAAPVLDVIIAMLLGIFGNIFLCS